MNFEKSVTKQFEIKGINLDIVNLLRQGKRVEDISLLLGISTMAVNNRVKYMRSMLNADTTVQLISMIVEFSLANQLKSR
jgi:DNA-binding CsgD family transcriptional regulator